MNKRNFCDLIAQASMYESKYENEKTKIREDDPKYERHKHYIKILQKLYNIGIFLQTIELELWDGYPHIYANMRVALEEIMNHIIENELQISEKTGYTFKRKIQIGMAGLTAKGIDLTGWNLDYWRDMLNGTCHSIYLPRSIEGFRMRFNMMQTFHDEIYRELVKMYFRYDVKAYQRPNEEELEEIFRRYSEKTDHISYNN